MPLSHFDERSGQVVSETPWGRWWQTVGEVFIEVNLPVGTRAKDVQVTIKANYVACVVRGKEVFKGHLPRTVVADESTWTVEEQKHLVILLVKADPPSFEKIWSSLLIDQFVPNPWILHEMEKKLDLERFQLQNPGFDFSGAKLSKSSGFEYPFPDPASGDLNLDGATSESSMEPVAAETETRTTTSQLSEREWL